MASKPTYTTTSKSREVTIEDLRKKKSGLVKVGVLSGMGKHPSSDSASFAEIAFYLEYGTETTNEYAPFRTWLSANRSEYKLVIRDLLVSYIKGDISLDKVVRTLGRLGANDLQDVMKNMVTPENEESTQLAKGAKTGQEGTLINNPTIDTGRLRQAISFGEV